MTESRTLQPGETIRPKIDADLASELVAELYGMKVSRIVELNSYDDQNFHVICESDSPGCDGYVLKITNSLDSRDTNFIQGQIEMLRFLNEHGISCPLPVRNVDNVYYVLRSFSPKEDNEKLFAVRLLTFKPGKILHRARNFSDDLLRAIGRFTARLDQTLETFRHPAYEERVTMWMLDSVPRLREFLFAIEDQRKKQTIEEVIEAFENNVLTRLDQFEIGIIHGDLNEQNLIVDDADTDVVAVLDLGDSQKSCLIFELAVNVCYVLLLLGDIPRAKHLLRGYQEIREIREIEKNVMRICICARICQSLVLGAYSYLNDPGNDYLLVTQKSGWEMLDKLWPMNDEEVMKLWDLE